ncbi:MAG: hypothetical protein CMH30_01220 [Micavibrio sp.]|nr:hypothetical protein [Micavibrio sp.]
MEEKACCGTKKPEKTYSIKDYWPLICLVLVSMASALTLSFNGRGIDFVLWMHHFMGIFLVIFATLKLFKLSGFAHGFAKYDLLASRHIFFGYLYPFVELALGLGYLSLTYLSFVYAGTIIVFGIGLIGVLIGLKKGLDMACPCMGAILSVPLSTVTVVENGLMVIMAVSMFYM